MAVKIEKGGWIMIFIAGLVLVGYSLYRYKVIDFSNLTGGSKDSSSSSEKIDASKPLVVPASSSTENPEVRVRLNVWVGCAAVKVSNVDATAV